MFTFFTSIYNSLPNSFWYAFGAFFGISSITTPIAIAFLVANAGAINYKAGGTEILLEGKSLNKINEDNLAQLEAQLKAQNQTILELTDAARKKNLEQKLKPELKELEAAVIESELRFEDVQESQEDLQNYIEEQEILP